MLTQNGLCPLHLRLLKKAIEEFAMSFTIHKGIKKEPEQINKPSKPWSIG